VPLLRTLGSELGFNVHGHAVVALDGEPVSSTRIREAIRGGRLDDATQMLGRPYSLAGTVVQGAQLGRKLGVPTANLDIAGRVLPPNGVYAAHAETPAGTCRAVVNIGVRPTLATQTPTVIVEAHLLDFDGNLYGQEVELTFVEQLRDEQRFPSLDALRAQIDRDIAHARRLFDS
jgi:riboflavin kinase / FMN adenylyltransferase